MHRINGKKIRAFAKLLNAKTVYPETAVYLEAIQLFNAAIHKKPAAIIYPRDEAEVFKVLCFCRDQSIELAVNGGCHSVDGYALSDGGLVLDLSLLTQMQIDPIQKTAILGAGVSPGALEKACAPFKLMAVHGEFPSVGFIGQTLNGGYSLLSRCYGMGCDNLISVKVVTPTEGLLTVDKDHHPDLFWALCGGGGNFGVVTEIQIRLHPQRYLCTGFLAYPLNEAKSIIPKWREYMLNQAPNELSISAVFATLPTGDKGLLLATMFCGEETLGKKILHDLRQFGTTLMDNLMPRSMIETLELYVPITPAGLMHHWRSDFFIAPTDEMLNIILQAFETVPSHRTLVFFESHGGAIGHIAPEATAYPLRQYPFNFMISGTWEVSQSSADCIRWTDELYQKVKPYLSGRAYLNYIGAEGAERIKRSYGQNYYRLQKIKQHYDPRNILHLNQNIAP